MDFEAKAPSSKPSHNLEKHFEPTHPLTTFPNLMLTYKSGLDVTHPPIIWRFSKNMKFFYFEGFPKSVSVLDYIPRMLQDQVAGTMFAMVNSSRGNIAVGVL